MAYFECTIGGSGGGAVITVTYDSSFYNKTMTCSNGVDTYTQTTTSSGVTEFEVDSEGTWTITCDGVVRTVDVTLSYSVVMMITKSITVYSAANDTLTFTDAEGSKTVTTNSSGVGVASITFIPPSQNITFTSSVAKNVPNADVSTYYSKTIAITDATSEIYVMPDGLVLYWYGYKNGTWAGYPYGMTGGWAGATISTTFNTNSMYYYQNENASTGGHSGILVDNKSIGFSLYSKAKLFFNSVTAKGRTDTYYTSQYLRCISAIANPYSVVTNGSKYMYGNEQATITNQLKTVDISNVTGTGYLAIATEEFGGSTVGGCYGTVAAIWLEE